MNNATKRGFWLRLYQTYGLTGPVSLVLGVAFLLVPLLPGEFPTIVAAEILILGLFAMSFNLIYGYMGQITFGHAAFFGVGAYSTALLMRALQSPVGQVGYLDFFLSLLIAMPVSALCALVVGYFCVRLTGIYFALLSLAFGELLYYLVFSWYSFTKGDDGIQGIMPPGIFSEVVNYYYLVLIVVAGCTVLLWRITNSPFGYTLRMIRDNQRRAVFLGINVRLVMLANFVLAGAFAGVAGALWGPFQRSVSPFLLGWVQSGMAVFMSLIGGAGFLTGPLVGSAIYTFLNAYITQFTVYWPLTIGLIILFLVLYLPGGVLSLLDKRLSPLKHHDYLPEDAAPEAARSGESS
ncbi:MAG: branched-chain amino acid ABC transporter permease [Desulfarculaceae bacterium]|nr:branched-chain amino acid ABC transporter permease [Desulfarculaceae bacterium]